MSIEKILVLSTSHLDPGTAEALGNGVHFGIDDVFTREYGYLMFTGAVTGSRDAGEVIPKCILDAAEVAELDGATLIMFDCDGDEDGRMQSWEW